MVLPTKIMRKSRLTGNLRLHIQYIFSHDVAADRAIVLREMHADADSLAILLILSQITTIFSTYDSKI